MFGVERSHGIELLRSNDLRTKVSCLFLEWCFMMWNMFVGKKSYLKGWFILFLEWGVVKMLIVISFEPLCFLNFMFGLHDVQQFLFHTLGANIFSRKTSKSFVKDSYSSLNRLPEARQEPTDSQILSPARRNDRFGQTTDMRNDRSIPFPSLKIQGWSSRK